MIKKLLLSCYLRIQCHMTQCQYAITVPICNYSAILALWFTICATTPNTWHWNPLILRGFMQQAVVVLRSTQIKGSVWRQYHDAMVDNDVFISVPWWALKKRVDSVFQYSQLLLRLSLKHAVWISQNIHILSTHKEGVSIDIHYYGRQWALSV